MGAKAECVCWYRGRSAKGVAHLETDNLIFRGDLKLAIPYRSVISATSAGGRLDLVFNGGEAIFELGDKASKWASKILDPPSLMKKLGVKDGLAVGLAGAPHEDFVRDLKRITRDVSESRMKKDRDLIFYGAERKGDLRRLKSLKAYLKPGGAIWVLRPKGAAQITESDVMEGGRKAGLVDVKVARFSDTHTAEKFVIPKAQRPKSSPARGAAPKKRAGPGKTMGRKKAITRRTKRPTKVASARKTTTRKKPTRTKPTTGKTAAKRGGAKKTGARKKPTTRATARPRKKATARKRAVARKKPTTRATARPRKKATARKRTKARTPAHRGTVARR